MEVIKAYELELELQKLKELRKSFELKLTGLEHAERIIMSNPKRRIYRDFSDLMVEITKDEALEHIESMRLVLRREIERLKKQEKEISEELAKLRASHS